MPRTPYRRGPICRTKEALLSMQVQTPSATPIRPPIAKQAVIIPAPLPRPVCEPPPAVKLACSKCQCPITKTYYDTFVKGGGDATKILCKYFCLNPDKCCNICSKPITFVDCDRNNLSRCRTCKKALQTATLKRKKISLNTVDEDLELATLRTKHSLGPDVDDVEVRCIEKKAKTLIKEVERKTIRAAQRVEKRVLLNELVAHLYPHVTQAMISAEYYAFAQFYLDHNRPKIPIGECKYSSLIEAGFKALDWHTPEREKMEGQLKDIKMRDDKKAVGTESRAKLALAGQKWDAKRTAEFKANREAWYVSRMKHSSNKWAKYSDTAKQEVDDLIWRYLSQKEKDTTTRRWRKEESHDKSKNALPTATRDEQTAVIAALAMKQSIMDSDGTITNQRLFIDLDTRMRTAYSLSNRHLETAKRAVDPDLQKVDVLRWGEYEKRPEVIERRKQWKIEFSTRMATINKRSRMLHPHYRQQNEAYWRDYYKISFGKLRAYALRSKTASISMTAAQFEQLNPDCFYCDIPIENKSSRKALGIDRIDAADRDYSFMNSVRCCWTCNMMKHTASLTDFLQAVVNIVIFQCHDDEVLIATFVKYDIASKGLGANGCTYAQVVARAKKKGYEMDLTQEMHAIVTELPCAYCGSVQHRRGLDRVDNAGGYLRSNVVSCCSKCNYMKGSMDKDAFIAQCVRITQHMTVAQTDVEETKRLPYSLVHAAQETNAVMRRKAGADTKCQGCAVPLTDSNRYNGHGNKCVSCAKTENNQNRAARRMNDERTCSLQHCNATYHLSRGGRKTYCANCIIVCETPAQRKGCPKHTDCVHSPCADRICPACNIKKFCWEYLSVATLNCKHCHKYNKKAILKP